jgi:hypothetical protein
VVRLLFLAKPNADFMAVYPLGQEHLKGGCAVLKLKPFMVMTPELLGSNTEKAWSELSSMPPC